MLLIFYTIVANLARRVFEWADLRAEQREVRAMVDEFHKMGIK